MVRRRTLLYGVAAGMAGIAGCPASETGSRTTARTSELMSSLTPGDLSAAWTSGPEMPKRRTQTTAVALDGELYVIGGIVGEGARHTAVYDPDAQRWRTEPAPPDPINHTSAVTYDGRIHVFGGYTGSFLGGSPRDVHWIYDPDAGEWSTGPSLPTARGALVAVVLDDRIYTIAGADESGTTGTVEMYDPARESWASAEPLPTAREHLAGGAIDGQAYAAGGRQGLSPMVDATACYDPAAGAWQTRSPMPTARAGIAGAVLEDFLFVFGGEEVGEQVFEEVAAYHPRTDTWTSVTPMPTPRWGLGVATLQGRIYTVGGGAVPSARETRTLEIMTVE